MIRFSAKLKKDESHRKHPQASCLSLWRAANKLYQACSLPYLAKPNSEFSE